MNPICRFVLPGLLLVAALAAQAAPPADKAGMVVDVQGAPRLVVDGAARKLELLAYLPPNARIEVDAGAQAAVSLYATRTVYRLTGPAVVQVEGGTLKPMSGNPPVARSLAQKLIASAEPANRVHAAVRMRDASTDVALVTPENGTVLLRAPAAFHWEATAPGPYTWTLVDAASPDTPLHVAQAQQTTWMLPAGIALQPGRTYRWTVAPGGGASAATAEFTVVDAVTATLLASIRPAADAPLEDWVLYATALQEHGVRDEARDAWKRIAAKRPDLAKARQLAR